MSKTPVPLSATDQTQNTRLTALETAVAGLRTSLQAVQALDVAQAATLTALQASLAAGQGRLTAIEAQAGTIQAGLSALQLEVAMIAAGIKASGGTTPTPGLPLTVGSVGTVTAVTPTSGTSVPVTIPDPVVTGGTPPYTTNTDPPSGSDFPPGTTPVVITVTDSGTPPTTTTTDTTVVVVVNPTGSGSGAAIRTDPGRVTVQSVGPITFGYVAPEGLVPAAHGLQVGAFPTQTDWLNTWGDGSLRHGLLSVHATSTGPADLSVIALPGGSLTPTWPTATVAFAISGTTYTATLPAFDGTHTVCNGAIARRAWVLVSPLHSATPHPTLQVGFEVTSYAAGGHKVGIWIQNIQNSVEMNSVTADVTTTVNGSTFADLTKAGWTIYTGQMWYRVAYTGMTEAVVTHDFGPWIRAHVIPQIVAADTATYDTNPATNPAYGLGGGPTNNFGYNFGEAEGNMGDSENGGRQELNPWTDWEARLFCLNTETYRQVVLANGNQLGGWTAQVDKNGDGLSILRVDEDGNEATVCTHPAVQAGLNWPKVAGEWRGEISGGYTPGYPNAVVLYDKEHVSEQAFIPYLLTGDRFYLQLLRFRASWAIFQTGAGGMTEPDPNVWPGYEVGRNGTRGELNDSEIGRGFGRPLKLVARAAWAMPDALSADQTYFTTITLHNLQAVARYIDYLDGKSWGGSWAHFVGFQPQRTTWGYDRSNSVTSTTGASPTVLTVVGDASGVGSGTNDHAMQTGDFVDLSGFSGGASGLNGHHAITRLSATTFSVAVNTTGSATSGQGAWSTSRGFKTPHWRISDGAREISWIGFTGLWSMTDSMWAFPDRLAQMEMAMQDNPDFDTAPGVSHNYYPTPGIIVGDDISFYGSWAAYLAANTRLTNTAAFVDSAANYTVYASTTHRGCVQGWNDSNPNEYYTPYATVMLAHASQRGLSGADTKYDRLVAASGVLPELRRRPGFYHERNTSTPVSGGGDLQTAIDAAQPGDTLVLQAGATYTGNFTLPNKSGASYITIRTATADGLLPNATTRIGPADASLLPTLTCASGVTLATEVGAHHWRLLGLRIVDTVGQNDLVTLGSGDETSLGDIPHDLIVDRCLIQGVAAGGTKRGIALNSQDTTIVNCYIGGIRRQGQDSQAICGWNGPGGYLIENNYLEAASENLMIGGADPKITNLIPTNITIRGNYLYKPLAWKAESGFVVKNLLELKLGKTILIENNVFENSWADGQIGFGIVITVRNQDGTADWSTIQDVTLRYNLIKRAEGPAVSLLGKDERMGVVSVQGTNLSISNLLVVGTPTVGVNSANGFEPTILTHCTFPSIADKFLSFDNTPMPSGNFTCQNVVAGAGTFGITGDGSTGIGLPSLDAMAPGSIFSFNLLGGPSYIPWPGGNTVVTADALTASLDPQLRYVGTVPSSDGLPLGCDIDGLRARIPWAVWP